MNIDNIFEILVCRCKVRYKGIRRNITAPFNMISSLQNDGMVHAKLNECEWNVKYAVVDCSVVDVQLYYSY